MILTGSPPRWLDRQLPYKVGHDHGKVFMDQNIFRMPTTPLWPLFEAVDHFAKAEGDNGVDWASVDIISDRKNLRRLLGWIGGKRDEFKIDMQLAGHKTVLFNPWSRHNCPRIRANPKSFGHSFEKASTVPADGCELTTGHHRIITYVSRSCCTLLSHLNIALESRRNEDDRSI